MKKIIGKLLYKVTGWKYGALIKNEDIKGSVLLAAPHTSNWDMPFALAVFWILGLDVKFFIKDEYTKGKFGSFFKWLGAIGVNRSQKNDLIDHCVELFKQNPDLILIVQGEGTRSYAEKWKTGFYHIAKNAHVPITLGALDFEKKKGFIDKQVSLEGKSKEEVFDQIQDYYKDIKGKFPENYNPKIH